MQEIKITNSPSQKFSVTINAKKVGMHLKYNTYTDRWTFDLTVGGVEVLHGRKIIPDIDLLKAFGGFDIGVLFATDTSNQSLPADRNNLPAGVVRIFATTQAELNSAIVVTPP